MISKEDTDYQTDRHHHQQNEYQDEKSKQKVYINKIIKNNKNEDSPTQ